MILRSGNWFFSTDSCNLEVSFQTGNFIFLYSFNISAESSIEVAILEKHRGYRPYCNRPAL